MLCNNITGDSRVSAPRIRNSPTYSIINAEFIIPFSIPETAARAKFLIVKYSLSGTKAPNVVFFIAIISRP